MKKSVLIYIFALAVVALLLLWQTSIHLEPVVWTPMVFITLMFIILEIMAIRLPSGPVISLSSGLSMVALFCFGAPAAILSATISMLAIAIIENWEYYRVVYNTSLYILSIYTAGVVFYAFNGAIGEMNILVPWPYIGAILMYFLVDSVLTAVLFSLLQEKKVFFIWYGMIATSFQTYIAVQMLAIVSAYMYINQGFIGVFLLTFFLLMLQMVFRSHYALLNKEKERAGELEAILNTAESGILMVDRGASVKMVNRRFEEIFRIEHKIEGIDICQLFQLLQNKLGHKANFKELMEEVNITKNIEVHLNGSKKVVKGSASPIIQDGEEIGRIVTFTDVTSEWQMNKQLRELYEAAIRSLVAAVDARDAYTSGHSSRVADLAVAIARKISLSESKIEVLRYAGLLHDIGKIGIDDRILRKKGPLDNIERAKMIEHPLKGVAILEEVHAFQELIPIVKYHHEWFDGNGYLEGLKGNEIPLGARIMAIADAFDAMTSNRSYRAALPAEEAIRRLIAGKGSQFDPNLVDVFVPMVKSGEIIVEKNEIETVDVMLQDKGNDAERGEHVGRILPRHGKEISILYQISLESHSLLRLEVYLQRVLKILHDALSSNLYTVYLNDENNIYLKLESSSGSIQYVNTPSQIPVDDTRVQEAFKSGKPVLSKANKDQILPYTGDACNSIVEVVVPIKIKENPIGLLIVKTLTKNGFSEDELYLLMTIAYQLGQTIEVARYHQKVVHAAKYDGLTDALNHVQFIKSLKEEIENAKTMNYPVSLCITDLDQFKHLNDSFGHLTGDEILRQFAFYLKKSVRNTDIVCRYGGDEFAIIFPNVSSQRAYEIVSRLLEGWNSKEISSRAGRYIISTTSFGVASFPDECKDVEELIHLADSRMYQHKRSKAELLKEGG